MLLRFFEMPDTLTETQIDKITFVKRNYLM